MSAQIVTKIINSFYHVFPMFEFKMIEVKSAKFMKLKNLTEIGISNSKLLHELHHSGDKLCLTVYEFHDQKIRLKQ